MENYLDGGKLLLLCRALALAPCTPHVYTVGIVGWCRLSYDDFYKYSTTCTTCGLLQDASSCPGRFPHSSNLLTNMRFGKIAALAGALLMPSLSIAASNDTEWPIHNDGLTTLVEWSVQRDCHDMEHVRFKTLTSSCIGTITAS